MNSQLFNRYTYAANNPLRYNDPDGHCGPLCLIAGGIALVALISGCTVDQNPINTASAPVPLPNLSDQQILEILGEANVSVSPSGGNPDGRNVSRGEILVATSIHDFSQRVGGVEHFRELIGGHAEITVQWYSSDRFIGRSVPSSHADPDGTIELWMRENTANRDGWNNFLARERGVVVHEFTHLVDYTHGYKRRISQSGQSVDSHTTRGLDGPAEYFASIVTGWIYPPVNGKSQVKGIYSDNSGVPWYPKLKQVEWLNENLIN